MRISIGLVVAGILAAGAAHAQRPHLVQPAELSKFWLVSGGTEDAKAPSYGKGLTTPTCVAVTYLIERSGATSHVKVEKVVPEGDLRGVGQNIMSVVRYKAAPENIGKDPVYTYVILPFNAPEVAKGPSAVVERQRILDQCKLDHFELPADIK